MNDEAITVDVDTVAAPIALAFMRHRDWAQVLIDCEVASYRDVVFADVEQGIPEVPESLRVAALAAAVASRLQIDAPQDRAWCRLDAIEEAWLRWCGATKGVDVLFRSHW